jgi:hypothetical protein
MAKLFMINMKSLVRRQCGTQMERETNEEKERARTCSPKLNYGACIDIDVDEIAKTLHPQGERDAGR